MRKFWIIPNHTKDKAYHTAKRITQWLECHDKEVIFQDTDKNGQGDWIDRHLRTKREAMEQADCVISLGGDGTIIQAARRLANVHVPILGVNLGNLGFLAEVEMKELESALEKIVRGEYTLENRMMVKADILREKESCCFGLALNDVVISRGAISRMIGFNVYVNNVFVNHYYADGIIISTPTGSTAYNLSAGGPILAPQSDVVAITPICPHSLTARSIVLPGSDVIRITFKSRRDQGELPPEWKQKESMIITIDGQMVQDLYGGDEIIISQAPQKTSLVKFSNKDFYTILRKKLENAYEKI
ncbi:NAD(+)/NADH kinase [Anaerotalea alkaliphila]|uniref:NAD kinase n=1 Tax=Anaerotalea alkaliphila TaxID=2662126 RepID=A0A7X5HT91_9FIRM|nr:NAD(+)/NADH kinase [Anaerotalea alkaliphila]NDL66263.1 NAD(+)/NADH kinase [Anaerotalea alkaliphila]